MSWFNRIARAIVVTATLALVLSGCSSLRPVYGESGITTGQVAVSYAEPGNRLEQIIYQDLALRLGKAPAGAGPEVRITAAQSSRTLTTGSIASPNRQRQMTVTATVRLIGSDGEVLYTAKRSASADYTTNPQMPANQQATTDAAERAAKAVADAIRLALLAALAAPAQ